MSDAMGVQPSSAEDSETPTADDPGFLVNHQFHVLVVEDDPLTLKYVEQLLKKCNYQVTTATNGREAMDILKRQATEGEKRVDLILTDILMPEVSGMDLINEVVHGDKWNNVPVIVMSSQESQESVLSAFQAGASDYLIKPVRRNELTTLWQHVWRANRVRSGPLPPTSDALHAAAAAHHAANKNSSGASTSNNDASALGSTAQPHPHHTVHHHRGNAAAATAHANGDAAAGASAAPNSSQATGNDMCDGTGTSALPPVNPPFAVHLDIKDLHSTHCSAAPDRAAPHAAAGHVHANGCTEVDGPNSTPAAPAPPAAAAAAALQNGAPGATQEPQQQQQAAAAAAAASPAAPAAAADGAAAPAPQQQPQQATAAGPRAPHLQPSPDSGSLRSPTPPLFKSGTAQPAKPLAERSSLPPAAFPTAYSNGTGSSSAASLPPGLQELAALGMKRQQERELKSAFSDTIQSLKTLRHSEACSAFTQFTIFLPKPRAGPAPAGGAAPPTAPSASLNDTAASSRPAPSSAPAAAPADAARNAATGSMGGPAGTSGGAQGGGTAATGGYPFPPLMFPNSLPPPILQFIENLQKEMQKTPPQHPPAQPADPASGGAPKAESGVPAADHRKAAVAKYLLKKKHRNFDKKVRYESRKRLAEQRPRVRGQFVRQEVLAAGDGSKRQRVGDQDGECSD